MNIHELEAARHHAQAGTPPHALAGLLSRTASRLGERSSPLFQLVILKHLKGFLRHIAVTTIRREFPGGGLQLRPGMSAEIHHDLFALAENLGVVKLQHREPTIRLRRDYAAVIAAADPAEVTAPAWQQDLRDYAEIRRLIAAQQAPDAARHLRRDDVRYLLVLARYILELEDLSLYEQVKPSFGSKFYSDLGEMAYQLYTSGSYRKLTRQLAPASFLDIGCGEGRHLVPVAELPGSSRIVGVELDPQVADSARRNLSGHPSAEIVSADLLDWRTDERFDMILSSYMLFYLERGNHVPFFRKVHDLLAPGGTYVLGQYFPDFEEYQQALIKRHSPVPGFQRWASDVGNSLLYAETLLNRTLAHFRSVIYWDTLQDDLAEAGLRVTEVKPADALFYSHYVLISRADDER